MATKKPKALSIEARLDAQDEVLSHILDLLAKVAENIVYIRDRPARVSSAPTRKRTK